MVSVTFFGTSSAIPSTERGFACIGVESQDDLILLDCGDGSLRNILKMGIDVGKISNILITHFHSDHLTGLTQIVEAMGIKRRETELNVFRRQGVFALPCLRDVFPQECGFVNEEVGILAQTDGSRARLRVAGV